MVPLPNVPSVVVMSWKWTYGSDLDVVCRAHFKYSGAAPGPANLTTWGNYVASDYTASVQSLFSSAVTLTSVALADLTSSTAGNVLVGTSHPGTRVGSPLDAATAALINWTIGRRYRGGKPRTYLPAGVTTDIATPQTWAAGSITAFNAWFTYLGQIETNYPGPGTITAQVNVSYYMGSEAVTSGSGQYVRGRTKSLIGPAPTYPIVDTITGGSFNQKPASQRRRAGFAR